MILAYYGALQPKPILVTEPYPHESGYGWYVSNAFTLGDTLLATFAQTPGHGVAAGLYGAVVGQSTDGTWLSFAHLAGNRGIVPTMSNALRDRGIAISLIAEPKVPRSRFMVQQAAEGAMKAALDSGHPLIVSGFLRFNGPAYNHLLVVCGYYVDNESFYWIVNDPFGFETDRSFDGHAIVYSTSEISPKYLYRFSEE